MEAEFKYADNLLGIAVKDTNVALASYGNVLVRKNICEENRVRIISGGPQQDYPAFAGFVGHGMLSAFIQGEQSEGPTPKLILRTIRELSVNHIAGILVILPANSTNLLNFGLAVERALNDNLSVKLCFAHDFGISAILMQKVAGAMADHFGKNLLEVWTYVTQLSENTKTISKDIYTKLAENVQSESIIVVFNNYGALSKCDELIETHKLNDYFKEKEIKVDKIYSGNFATNPALKMSVTILNNFDTTLLTFLDASCAVAAWQPTEYASAPQIMAAKLRRNDRLSPLTKGPELSDKHAHMFELAVQHACDALISCERMLNLIDTERGDGDAGTRLRHCAEIINKRLASEKLVAKRPFMFFTALSKILEASVGSTCGCIYGIMFEAAAQAFAQDTEVELVPQLWLTALENATVALQKYGKSKFGNATMYDSVYGCADITMKYFNDGVSLVEAFEYGVVAAQKIAENTSKVDAKFKYPDSGAHAVGIWMRAAYEAVKLDC